MSDASDRRFDVLILDHTRRKGRVSDALNEVSWKDVQKNVLCLLESPDK